LKCTAWKSVREELVRLLPEKSNLSRREIATALVLNREMVRRITLSRDLSF
jgi:predicted ArsR family transcriptional regulator